MERSRGDWELLVIISSLAFKDWGASEGLLGRGRMWSACHLKSLTGIAVLVWEHCRYTSRSRGDCISPRPEETRVCMRPGGKDKGEKWSDWTDLEGGINLISWWTAHSLHSWAMWNAPPLASRRTSLSFLVYVSDFVVFFHAIFPAFASLSQLLALLFPQASPLPVFSLSFPVMTSSLSCAQSLQLHPTLCDPMDCNLSGGSSVHEILQARMLEWVAMPSSRGFSQFRDWTLISYVSCIALEIECIQIPIASAYLSWALMLCFQLFISRLLLKPQSSSQSSRFETLCPYCTSTYETMLRKFSSLGLLFDVFQISPICMCLCGLIFAFPIHLYVIFTCHKPTHFLRPSWNIPSQGFAIPWK